MPDERFHILLEVIDDEESKPIHTPEEGLTLDDAAEFIKDAIGDARPRTFIDNGPDGEYVEPAWDITIQRSGYR